MPKELNIFPELSPLSISILVLNLFIGIILSLIIRWHFKKFGSTLSNREEFAQVFPFILLTTILIITVVKSSLALSLGLVGALSIVRFRTPIKEPEELAYLFISIAMGLGLGANQTLPTIVAGCIILGAMAFLGTIKEKHKGKNIYLSIDWIGDENDHPEKFIDRVSEIIVKHVINCDLRRFDIRTGSLEATYFVDFHDSDNISALTDELRRVFPSIGLTFLDQNQLPSV
jgi:hypothetical protein